MSERKFDLEEAVAILERTPESLNALLRGLPETWLSATEEDESWSPYDVIGHLIQGERTDWMARARHILSGEQRPFDPFDRTAQFADSKGKSVDELLSTFATLRRQKLAELAAMKLTSRDMDRKGQHPDIGEVTLGQLLSTWLVHDMDHVSQIARTIAKVYTGAVGPWTAYLSILKDRV